MKLSARRGLECRILHHLSQSSPAVKGVLGTVDDYAVRINLPATFQFSPATSKSIDIPVLMPDACLWNVIETCTWDVIDACLWNVIETSLWDVIETCLWKVIETCMWDVIETCMWDVIETCLGCY